jgi:uncharacterized protein DUF4410
MKTNQNITWENAAQAIGCGVAISMLVGCASTAPSARFKQPIPPESRVAASDKVSVKVDPKAGVSMLSSEKQRLTEQIQAKIRATARASARARAPRGYEVDVQLNQYEKGSAFARAMLAGLGQMHIDGDVLVYQLPNRAKIGEFHLNKTFAWGGMYGASMTIEALEESFAQGVANAVCSGGR